MSQAPATTDRTANPGPSQKAELMRAARYHGNGESFTVDLVDKPSPRPTDVVVQVRACGFVPNLVPMLNPPPQVIAPARPTIYGLDAVGVVAELGSQVYGFSAGDRVYVNPHRYCGACRACRRGNPAACAHSALNGYFGVGPKSRQMLQDYPIGGFADYMTAPQNSLVKLPDNVSWETATRWGYLGTGYAALRRADADHDTTLLINGISGTLGLGTALFALALGVPRIFGVGHDIGRLAAVKAIDPQRISVASVNEIESVEAWVRSETGGLGADIVIDALPTGGSPEAYLAAVAALAPGGTHVNIGGVLGTIPIDVTAMMLSQQSFLGSFWLSTTQGEEMARLVGCGIADLSVFENVTFDLEHINEAVDAAGAGNQHGGFTNYVIIN